jgi:hypothetical protein
MPGEMARTVLVAWKREKEGRTIESVFLAKLRKLFWSGLLAKNCDGGIAWHQLDE